MAASKRNPNLLIDLVGQRFSGRPYTALAAWADVLADEG
jgi:hypothetical protein